MSMLEAECTRCKGVFVPHGTDPEDLIHCYTDEEEECGGIGIILGEWHAPDEATLGLDLFDIGEYKNLTAQEKHGVEHPSCDDPDCEFHHPELMEGR